MADDPPPAMVLFGAAPAPDRAVGDGLARVLGSSTIAIEDAVALPGPGVRHRGRAVVLHVPCEVETYVSDDGLLAVLIARPVGREAWPLAASFPRMPDGTDEWPSSVLHGASLSDPVLLVTAPASAAWPAPDHPVPHLWEGWRSGRDVPLSGHRTLSLFGSLTLPAELEALTALAGAPVPLGTGLAAVHLDDDALVPALVAQVPLGGTVELGPLQLTDGRVIVTAPVRRGARAPAVGLAGAVVVGGQRIDLRVDDLAGPGPLSASGTLHASQLQLPGAGPGAPLPILGQGEQVAAEVWIDVAARRVERLAMLVHRDRWDVVDDLLSARDLTLSLAVDDPLGASLLTAAATAEVVVGDLALAVGAFYPPWRASGTLAPGVRPRLRELAAAVGIDDAIVPDLTVRELSVDHGISSPGSTLRLSLAEDWSPAPDLVHLERVDLLLQGPRPARVRIDGSLALGRGLSLAVGGGHEAGRWSFTGRLAGGAGVAVGALLDALVERYGAGIHLPDSLRSLALLVLDVSYGEEPHPRFAVTAQAGLRVAGAAATLDLAIDVTAHGARTDVDAKASITVSGYRFRLAAQPVDAGDQAERGPGDIVVASYDHDPASGTGPPALDALVAEVFPELAPLVPPVGLKAALLAHLPPAAPTGGPRSTGQQTGRWLFGAALDADVAVGLDVGDSPVLASLLGDGLLSVSGVQVLAASGPIGPEDVVALGDTGPLALPPGGVPGALLTATLQIGDDRHEVHLSFSDDPTADPPPPGAGPVPEAGGDGASHRAASAANSGQANAAPNSGQASGAGSGRANAAPARDAVTSGDPTGAGTSAGGPSAGEPGPQHRARPGPEAGTTWIELHKTVGPVHLERIGVRYDAPRLVLTLSASVSAGGLTLSLQGLGASLIPGEGDPRPVLDGIDVAYRNPSVAISGGLARKVSSGIERFDGEAHVSAAGFTLAALASYAATASGHPSLFVFGLLDADLGGPPLFHVTGLAAGFGYGRRLVLPSLDEVGSFPLVAMATGSQAAPEGPDGALERLIDVVPVAPGQLWLAAGVRFTSFEVVRSFALLTVSVGAQVQLDLLGESILTMPPELGPGQQPIASARLAERASFVPDQGVLRAGAKLSPDSYIFSRECRLTGGFALAAWFKDQPGGGSAGDFVVTLGGYHPHFSKPAHYPDAAPIGFAWQLGDLVLKGGLYAAITPTAVMAGGYLDAVWEGGGIRAWFSEHADFLLSWKPFHYEISVGVELGVSFRVDLLFVSFTVSVSIGVDLELWGPSFGGSATVDLALVSFTIGFGPGRPVVAPISWPEFRSSFLPALVESPTSVRLPPGSADHPGLVVSDSYCSIRVAAGLDRDDGNVWVVNGSVFELVVESTVPVKTATCYVGDGSTSHDLVAAAGATPVPFDLGPVDVDWSRLTSEQFVFVARLDDAGRPEQHADVLPAVVVTARLANVPKALWSAATAMGQDGNRLDGATPLVGGALVGFSLRPRVTAHGAPAMVDVDVLQEDVASGPASAAWTSAPASGPADQRGRGDEQAATPATYAGVTAAMVEARATRRVVVDAIAPWFGLEADDRVETIPADLHLVLRDVPSLEALGAVGARP